MVFRPSLHNRRNRPPGDGGIPEVIPNAIASVLMALKVGKGIVGCGEDVGWGEV
jgi:hypothetical protein